MDYFSFCEDESVRIKVEGNPVHRFFAPEGFLLYGLEPKLGNTQGYTQVIDMPITEFLGLAEPIPKDDLDRHAPMEDFKRDVLNGKSTDWELPYLVIKENEDGIWRVIGHDGRHRGMLLKSIGYDSMPVRLSLPDARLNEELLPEILWCQNDKSVEREKDFYPFPITEDNFMQPYVVVENDCAKTAKGGDVIAMDGIEYGSGCDAPNLKNYLGEVNTEDKAYGGGYAGKAPDSCTAAKRNFAKNFVPNVAYRKDNTMPAANLKEYLSKRGK